MGFQDKDHIEASKQIRLPDGNSFNDSTLAGWHPPAKPENSRHALIDMGWGKIIFAHTFSDKERLITALSDEKKGRRNIAFYLREPHVILSHAPQEIFLDPSHSYRLWFDEKNRLNNETPVPGIVVKEIETLEECKAINEIYQKNGMVLAPAEFIFQNRKSNSIQYLAAIDEKTNNVLGSITGLDHYNVFQDSEQGASFWCLSVDPRCPFPGVGKALVMALAAIYKKRKRAYMDLSVLHSNTEAIQFYENLGFVRVPVFTLKYKNAWNEPLYTPSESFQLNPYAEIIIKEARRRGIQVNILRDDPAIFELTFGGRAIVCNESLTDHTSAISMTYCQNKYLTASLLRENNLRTPCQLLTNDYGQALEFFNKYKSVVVKPVDGEQGHKVFVHITKETEFHEAFNAVKAGGEVLIEEYFEGDDIRVVVINGEVVAAAMRKVAEIAGTGEHTIEMLIKKLNRRRLAATGGESKIPMDKETERCIKNEGWTMNSILPKGKKLKVRKTANLHTGGTLEDITDTLHVNIKEAAIRSADILGIPVVGLDFMVKPRTGEFCIIEANERPGLANHEPQPTVEKFIDFLFPLTIPTITDSHKVHY